MGESSGAGGNAMDIVSVSDAIRWQAQKAEEWGAPNTARLVWGLLPLLDGDTAVGRRMATWQGHVVEDAMPLRIAGGFHYLALTGVEPRLADIYTGRISDQGAVDALVGKITRRHDAELLTWLDGPPQTNEAGRAAAIMAALLWLSPKVGETFRLFELGASAGACTMLDRYAFDLGGVRTGIAASPVQLVPDWEGEGPPDSPVIINGVSGCDLNVIDLGEADEALRLKSYVWPDAEERLRRMDGVIALATEHKPDLVQMDAADFVDRALAERIASGTVRALFHTIMWQYMPQVSRDRITTAMESAGAAASEDQPLAWIMLEPNRESFAIELRARFWPGDTGWITLAETHPHGAWIAWKAAS